MEFKDEKEFEDALVKALTTSYGWDSKVIEYPTEEDLIANWAQILFDNNRGRDRLNEVPLTQGEIGQVFEQIRKLRTPCLLNGFINGKEIRIKRDAEADAAHFGKEVTLKIYDRNEIAGGKSRYQIARQPRFKQIASNAPKTRGDLTLLINGMPLVHIELKKSGVSLHQPCNQIRYYSELGVFSGLFSLIQIFFAMTPEEAVYFANPGPDGKFNSNFYFHWADANNSRVDVWKRIASDVLSIPMAHQLIGFYTVADETDGTLKVMRSYQYYAARGISTAVSKHDWSLAGPEHQRGGYVWHTTGSGKTLTSFKSAQLIKESGDADKVVFLMDRIELGTQSLREYRAFADADVDVQDTPDTYALLTKLKSDSQLDKLIVTSIQKASLLHKVEGDNDADFEKIGKKRIVFIVDEAHRSTFGEMLSVIKDNFPRALFFGFTGTPILEENKKKQSVTADIFGSEIHRYSVADGIRDKNVLGFDHYKISTYREIDLRKQVGLHEAKAGTVEEAMADPKKKRVFMNWQHAPMPRKSTVDGKEVKGVESKIPVEQYSDDKQGAKHREKVVEDIVEKWTVSSVGGKFHAILAASSIVEAIKYYRLFKEKAPALKVTALFDPNVNYSQNEVEDDFDDAPGQMDYDGFVEPDECAKLYASYKTEALLEILEDYGKRFNKKYSYEQHASFKRDLASRLAHKDNYIGIERKPEEQIDLVIVVDQLLTGFDSKWINVLYLDKELKYERLIQAFSRTNRIFGQDKPFGTVRYYRYPHTMAQNVEKAFRLYSGETPYGIFADKLDVHLKHLNAHFENIERLFKSAGIENFERLPEEPREVRVFARYFSALNESLQAARIQGFSWEKLEYSISDKDGKEESVTVLLDKETYRVLLTRYREIERMSAENEGVPFDIDATLTEIDVGKIDSDYLDSRFEKYVKALQTGEEVDAVLVDLHKCFAELSQEDQRCAQNFLTDVQQGNVAVEPGKSFLEYVAEYRRVDKISKVKICAEALGLDWEALWEFIEQYKKGTNVYSYPAYTKLEESVDKEKARTFLEKQEGRRLLPPQVATRAVIYLKGFIEKGDWD